MGPKACWKTFWAGGACIVNLEGLKSSRGGGGGGGGTKCPRGGDASLLPK